MAVSKEVTKEVRTREKRRPFGVPVSRLSVYVDVPGFHLRWINDEPGRLALALQSGYSFVEPEEVGRVGDEANRVKEQAGVQRDGSTPLFMYLMKIPQEYYEEDRTLLDGQVDKIDEAIRAGKLEKQSGDGRYVPSGGISYKTK